jgi:hypothetical protein
MGKCPDSGSTSDARSFYSGVRMGCVLFSHVVLASPMGLKRYCSVGRPRAVRNLNRDRQGNPKII